MLKRERKDKIRKMMRPIIKKSLLKALLVVPAAGLLFFICSCGSSPVAPPAKFPKFMPYQALSTAEIAAIGADGFSGSHEAIARAILNWQDENMKWTDPSVKEDVSYPMRWNYIMPGIYPVGEMITERTLDDEGKTKIYGVCWDFAAVFCAIAKHYGLDARVAAYKEYISGVPGGRTGMSPQEYEAMKVRLQDNGLSYSYDQINAAARETWKHYRAEVFIDGAWKAFDGTYPTGDYADDSNYSPALWDEGADPDLTE